MMGHWAGVCTASSKDKPTSKGAGKHGKDGKGKAVKKAFVVTFPGELFDEQPLQDSLVTTSTSALGTSSALGPSS